MTSNERMKRFFLTKNVLLFQVDHPLIKADGKDIHMPEGTRRDQFLAWIDGLPDKQSPDWLGLPTNAETVLLTNLGKNQKF